MSKAIDYIKREFNRLNEEKENLCNSINSTNGEIEEIKKKINDFLILEESPQNSFLPAGAGDDFEKIEINRLREQLKDREDYVNSLKNNVDKINDKIIYVDGILKEEYLHNKEINNIYEHTYLISATNANEYIDKISILRKIVRQDPARADIQLGQLQKEIINNLNVMKRDIIDKLEFENYINMQECEIQFKQVKNMIKDTINHIKKSASIEISSHITGDGKNLYNSELIKTVIFIIIELTNNSIQHSNSEKIKVDIDFLLDSIVIIQSDDGEGFDYKEVMNKKLEEHFGITIIEDRVKLFNGNISFENLKTGIKYTITLPI